MEYKEISASVIQEGVWNEKYCIRRTAGFTLDKTNLPTTLEYLPKGAVLAYKSDVEKAVVVKTAKVYEAANASTTVKVSKNHVLIVGDYLNGQAISAIDTTNANYDILTMAVAITAAVGDVLSDANAEKAIGLNYATIKLDSNPSCTPTIQAYEIEEDSLPYPVNDKIKTALTVRHDWKI